MIRAATVGTHPLFVQMLCDLIEERLSGNPLRAALGDFPPGPDTCPADCCPNPKLSSHGRSPSSSPPLRRGGKGGSRDEAVWRPKSTSRRQSKESKRKTPRVWLRQYFNRLLRGFSGKSTADTQFADSDATARRARLRAKVARWRFSRGLVRWRSLRPALPRRSTRAPLRTLLGRRTAPPFQQCPSDRG
jgi:hypothetical protein